MYCTIVQEVWRRLTLIAQRSGCYGSSMDNFMRCAPYSRIAALSVRLLQQKHMSAVGNATSDVHRYRSPKLYTY